MATFVAPRGFVRRVASGVARGMAYLHACGVMHRDLKGSNVLLGGMDDDLARAAPQGSAAAAAVAGAGAGTGADAATAADDGDGGSPRMVKLADFGLCVSVPDDTRRSDGGGGGHLTAETGTYRWMAPEIIRHERYSRSADVYSFAMIVYELLTHQAPFADRSPLQAAAAAALSHARPRLPDGVPPPLLALLRACWAEEPSERPSFRRVSDELAALGAQLSREEVAWLDDPDGHRVYSGEIFEDGSKANSKTSENGPHVDSPKRGRRRAEPRPRSPLVAAEPEGAAGGKPWSSFLRSWASPRSSKR